MQEKEIEDFQGSKCILVLTDEFSKVAGFKIRIQNSVVFLNVHNKPFERETGKVSLIVTLKKVRYLEVNLMSKTYVLKTENYQ